MWSSCSRGTVTGVGSLLMAVRPITLVIFVILVIFVRAVPTHAQQQSVTLTLGYFAVRGEDARISDDVLVENLETRLFTFRLGDFNNVSAGGEWLIGLGEYVEAGVGLGFYRRTVASTYAGFVDDVDGSEIEQDLKLRVIPFTTTIRFLPFGRSAAVQPYVGGGLGIYAWRYSEVGDFIDFSNFDIFREQFVAEGNDVGTVVLGGVRMPFG